MWLTDILFILSSLAVVAKAQWIELNCPAPRSPINGVSFIFKNGQKVQYRCHPGFFMTGEPEATCRNNKWSHSPPVCITQDTYDDSCIKQPINWAPKFPHAHVNEYNRAKNTSFPHNYYVEARYNCEMGYTLEDKDRSKLLCKRREWVGSYPKCISAGNYKKDCSENNGGCQHICTFAQGKILCSCRPGYTLGHNKKSCGRFSKNQRNDIQGDDSRELSNICKIDNGGCDHICGNVEGKEVCSCFRGFELAEDGHHCRDINECLIDNGGCEKKCNNFPGHYSCRCPDGYKLAANRKTCHDINECLSNNGHGPCDEKCNNTNGGYICSCTGLGTVLAKNNHSCEDIDECADNNFGCSHKCYNIYGNALCSCPIGYELGEDDKTCIDYDECEIPEHVSICKGKCINTIGSYECENIDIAPASCKSGYKLNSDGICEDINECEEDNFGCSHKCQNTQGSAHCLCPKGLLLTLDNKNCEDIDECAHTYTNNCHQQCINIIGSFKCECLPGYIMRKHGICQDIDECKDKQKNNCNQQCINTIGSFKCKCLRGYVTSDNGTCEDIDECKDERRHNCHHQCVNTIGSFSCKCSRGYIMLSNNTCLGCRKNSYRPEDSEFCLECPPNSHTNETGKTSLSECICDSGFSGDPSQELACLDINECEIENGNCSDICVNIPGSFICMCKDGYTLDKDGKTCVDIDECSINKGGCHQGCINTEGSFRCFCSEGFLISESNLYTCTDIDECLKNTGECSQKCVNYEGGYYCACKNGYRLASDFRSCVEITCPHLPDPHYGNIHCNFKSDDGEIPANTTCHTTCKKGYRIDGSKILKCGKDGNWLQEMPSCKPLSCPPLQKPKHGDVQPSSCLNGTVIVQQKCYFTCNPGYQLIGRAFLKCSKYLEWHPKEAKTVCESNELTPFIKCPADITVELKPQENKYHLRIPEPKSNMDSKYVQIYPKWIELLEGDFPAGITTIYFTTRHPSNSNLTASCQTTVNILDNIPPTVKGCPGTIIAYSDTFDTVEVTWKEPIFTDNVEIASITKSMEPGSRFNLGEHIVHYTAYDSSGGVVMCVFTVKVLRRECDEPKDILHGSTNCMDFLGGILCEPYCESGYAFYNNNSQFYMCGMDGIWKPSKVIPDCSPFNAETENGCVPGTELREEIHTGNRICVACLQGMYWETYTSSCVQCPKGTYQNEYGQTTCKNCPEDDQEIEACKELDSDFLMKNTTNQP